MASAARLRPNSRDRRKSSGLHLLGKPALGGAHKKHLLCKTKPISEGPKRI